jgi:hypothetical protein
MKERSFHHRARTFKARLFKPGKDRNSFRSLSPSRPPGTRTKRIFIIKQAIQLPPTNSTAGKKVQHVLIFDDHPESLRLVFGSTTPKLDFSPLPNANSWHLVLLSILVVGLVTAVLWPLF